MEKVVSEKETSFVVIIGAGISGLAAAAYLHKEGWKNVTILEGRNRLGGRAYTRSYGSCGVEMGAQWVHGQKGNVIFELAKENNLIEEEGSDAIDSIGKGFCQLETETEKLLAIEMCQAFYFDVEEELIKNSNVSKVSNMADLFRNRLKESNSDWLKKSQDNPDLPAALYDWNCRFQAYICGSDQLENVSLTNIYRELEGCKTGELKDHYRSVVEFVRDSIPQEWIKLNSEVREINWRSCQEEEGDEKVRLTLFDGSILKDIDYVIVTVPLGVLKMNYGSLFKPSLPARKIECIEKMGFGSVDKIFLIYENPFWKDGDVFNVLWFADREQSQHSNVEDDDNGASNRLLSSMWTRDIVQFTSVRHQANVLCTWISAQGAREAGKLPDQEVASKCHRTICHVLKNSDLKEPSDIFRSNWTNDRFSRGSYSYVSVDCENNNLSPSDLAEPLFVRNSEGKESLKVLFAGEATHGHFYSTVHGAFESGQREGKRLTESVQQKIVELGNSRCNTTSSVEKGINKRIGNVINPKKSIRIAIIGAGIAGLSAAQKLSEAHFENVLILEATNRIGGRIHSLPFGSGVLELGAQWVHGQEGNALYDYSRNENLIGDPGEDFSLEGVGHFLSSSGQILNRLLVEKTISALETIKEDIMSEMRIHHGRTRQTMGEAFQKRFDEYLRGERLEEESVNEEIMRGIYRWFERFEIIDNSCESLSDLSISGFREWIDCSGVALINFKKGFQSIIDCLVRDAKGVTIKLSSPVQTLHWKMKKVEKNIESKVVVVESVNGERLIADHVIVTSSAGFLKENAQTFFQPNLPEKKMAALNNIGFGTVNKIYLVFEKPFWTKKDLGFQFVWIPENKQLQDGTTESRFPVWVNGISGFDTVRGQPNVLLGWIGGKEAQMVEEVPEDTLMIVCRNILRQFLGKGEEIETPKQVLRSKWFSEPYTRGAYSHRLKNYEIDGTSLEDYIEPLPTKKSSSDDNFESFPSILFAGEASHRHFFSSAHGAMETGWREAQRIIDYWRTPEGL